MNQLISIAELGEVLGVSRRTATRIVADLSREGREGVYRIRHSWRCDLPKVLEALQERTRERLEA